MNKPVSCEKCPAVEISKGTIVCGCMRILKADITKYEEKLQMWRKCPLAWDKEEK